MSITRLRVDDQNFLVSSLIERCPRIMMLRELVQNALEAAAQLPANEGIVRIGSVEIEGTRKLRIWNSAIGLNRRELHRICDIASSVNKKKGLNLHFGMGAKISSLGANPLGVRYRSCKSAEVHEVILGKRDGFFGRVWRLPDDSAAVDAPVSDVVDVTQAVVAEGVDVTRDWVDVTLLGQQPDQDTVADPYDGDPKVGANWIAETLFYRFFTIPEQVKLILEPSATGLASDIEFQPFSKLAPRFDQSESITLSDGVTVHYAFNPPDPRQPWRNRLTTDGLETVSGFAAVVHGGEMYDVRSGSPWAYIAPPFGVTVAARHVAALIELPDDYPVMIDGYRQFLRYTKGEQRQVYTPDFARRVREARPSWLSERLKNLSAQTDIGKKLHAELKTLANRLGVTFPAPSHDLEIIILTDIEDIRGRWLRGRAGSYYPETAQLFINASYESVEQLRDALQARARGLATPERIAAVCAEVALTSIVRVVARALIFGLSKSSRPDLWQSGHIEKAVAPESLSICASDFDLVIDRAAAEVEAALTPPA